MTIEKLLFVTLACGALAACTPPSKDATDDAPAPQGSDAPVDTQDGPPVTTPDPVPADCDVASYQSLVGSNVAAVTLPADLAHRIYKQGDPVTMDYRPDRLNIVTDENGVVIEVKCG
jgi:hypothetical protein